MIQSVVLPTIQRFELCVQTILDSFLNNLSVALVELLLQLNFAVGGHSLQFFFQVGFLLFDVGVPARATHEQLLDLLVEVGLYFIVAHTESFVCVGSHFHKRLQHHLLGFADDLLMGVVLEQLDLVVVAGEETFQDC